jgi:transposase InsO family protein
MSSSSLTPSLDIGMYEIDRLQALGVFKPIAHSDWAAPLVPIVKADKHSIRLCGDYKVTINRAAVADQYAMPKAEDIFARLAGGKTFSKLDFSEAYAQLVLDEASQQLAAVNTPKGLFAVTRLPYGTSPSAAIFQRTLDNLLRDVPNTAVYIDDIILAAEDEAKMLHLIDTVLAKLEAAGLRLNKTKCSFMQPAVTYLAHVIDKDGLHPTKDKVTAIVDAPPPTDVATLRSFIGLITFYAKFIPNHATLMAPLYTLLQQGEEWRWTHIEQQAFDATKQALLSSQLLVHFDPSLPVTVACDASPVGVGAVLSNVINGEERPVMFISRALSSAERNYSQIERESLAIIFAVTRLRQFLLGRPFTVWTDNKPLLALFDPTRRLPAAAAARVLRWSILLGGYDYRLKFRRSEDNGNADALSRLPISSVQPSDIEQTTEIVLFTDQLDDPPCTATEIRKETARDPLLSQIVTAVRSGVWPTPLPGNLTPFYKKRDELAMTNDTLMWGQRVVIPQKLQSQVKTELHSGHFGSGHMKALARSYVWWPNMDDELEAEVAACQVCQQHAHDPPRTAVHPWPWPTQPWLRLHIDFAGPVEGLMLLIVVDAHSKWIEALPMRQATSQSTITALRLLFATHGIPEVLVSDNGTCFTSAEFMTFCEMNKIRHLRIPPRHPASNGLAERAVQTVKEGLRKQQGSDIHCRLAKFLLSYRTTPQSTTGVTPAELLMKRRLRTRLDLLRPSLSSTVEAKQEKWPGVDRRERVFQPGDNVYVRNYGQGDAWLPGTVVDKRSSTSMGVQCDRGLVHVHADQARTRRTTPDRYPVMFQKIVVPV